MSEHGLDSLANLAQKLPEGPIRVDFTVQMESEWLISPGFGRGGADLSVVLDADGMPEIPQRSMRGLTREAIESLTAWYPDQLGPGCLDDGEGQHRYCGMDDPAAPPCPACRIFGSPLRAGQWHISPAGVNAFERQVIVTLDGHADSLRSRLVGQFTRVAINQQTGTADEHKLYTFQPGREGLVLEGFAEEKRPLETDPNRRALDLVLLCAALGLVRHAGAQRRKGSGSLRIALNGVSPGPRGFTEALPELLISALGGERPC